MGLTSKKRREIKRRLRELSKACKSGLALQMMLRSLYPDQVDRNKAYVRSVDELWKLAEEAQELSGCSLPPVPARDTSEGGYCIGVSRLRRWAAQSWLEVRCEKKPAMPKVAMADPVAQMETVAPSPATPESSLLQTTEPPPLFTIQDPCWIICGNRKVELRGNSYDLLKLLAVQDAIPLKEVKAALGGCSQGSYDQIQRRLNRHLAKLELPFNIRTRDQKVCVIDGEYKVNWAKRDK